GSTPSRNEKFEFGSTEKVVVIALPSGLRTMKVLPAGKEIGSASCRERLSPAVAPKVGRAGSARKTVVTDSGTSTDSAPATTCSPIVNWIEPVVPHSGVKSTV